MKNLWNILVICFVASLAAPHLLTGKYANEIKTFNAVATGLARKPVLAIGSANETLWPGVTTLDSVTFLGQSLKGASVTLMQTKSSKHAKDLISGDKNIRKSIVDWIVKNS